MSKSAPVFWLTGLSGAGKTTLSKHVKAELEKRGTPHVVVDGDVIRELFGRTENYDENTRLEMAYKYAKISHFLAEQGIAVVTATMSLFHEVQAWNREHNAQYYEVFVKRDLKQLEKEDYKGLYAKSRAGEIDTMVGIDIEPEYPKKPEMTVDNADKDELPGYASALVEMAYPTVSAFKSS